LNKSFEKCCKKNNNLSAACSSNQKEKNIKELYDAIEFDLTNCEIDYVNNNIININNNVNNNTDNKNEFDKFVIYKNNQNINIAKLSTSELIRIINNNSKVYFCSSSKNSDLKDKELTYKNQRKKLRNSASSHNKKSSAMQSGSNSNAYSSNAVNCKVLGNANVVNNNHSLNIKGEDNMIIPFDAEISLKSVENGNHNKGCQIEDMNVIREKIGDQVK